MGLMIVAMTSFLYAGNQAVDLRLDLTFPGASQKIIDDKLVVDLGYLKEGEVYTGAEIGKVTVEISQRKTTEDTGCILDDMEFDRVNINKLLSQDQRINVLDKQYVGKGSNLILTTRNIKILKKEGDINPSKDELFFVSKECLDENVMQGVALTKLQYEFGLYVDINDPIKLDTVVGAFAQDERGVLTSLKGLVINQITGSLSSNRRRK